MEKDILLISRWMIESWENAREFFGYPNLPRPKLVNDESMGGAFITMYNHQIMLNKDMINSEVEDFDQLRTFIDSLMYHEMGHFCFWPFDLKTLLLVELEAMKYTERHTSTLRNLFDDIIVNLHLHKNGPENYLYNLYRGLTPEYTIFKILDAYYRCLIKNNPGYKGSHRINLIKLQNINFLDLESWRENLRLFWEVIRDYINEFPPDYQFIDGFDYCSYADEEIEKAIKSLKDEIDDEQKFRRLTGRIIQKLQRPGPGGHKRKNIKALCESILKLDVVQYYKKMAEKYLFRIKRKEVEKQLTGIIKGTFKKWEIDDGVEDLDVFNSYGKIMPGISQRWVREPIIIKEGQKIPDALICMDSSASMDDPNMKSSYAVIGGFCAARGYFQRGARVGAINFSDNSIVTPFTRDRDKIYKALTEYQNGGTILNVNVLYEQLDESKGCCDVIIITDMGVYNLNEVLKVLLSIRKRRRCIIIQPHKELKEKWLKLRKENIFIYSIKDEADIPRIIIGETNRF